MQQYNGKPLAPLYTTRPKPKTDRETRRHILKNRVYGGFHGLDTPCWNSTFCRRRDGYPHMSFLGRGYKYPRIVAQVLMELEYGPANGRHVLHNCVQNKLCVSLNHLRYGTNRLNCIDKVFDETNNALKIPNAEVPKIREMYASGKYSYQAIADTYNVGRTQIRRIVHGESSAQ